ncbi:hypothetical protein HCQ94_04700 [Actinomyces sp. zg-332]|uniref:diacylglycerol/lipid kinase family protein n=1 Tax=Actinomyces sp. zg-332 TaxID=2708340 RepID=UPI001420D4FE|nr:diacylglycerol kinase family protein [Actinomyces sp. zg-332]QPK93886.1 hypothetical protein HCQ94_04700 [Actinomyces sp. zg-332]
MELLLCVSATSGAGNALKIGPEIAKIFSSHGWKVTVNLTDMNDDLTKIATNTHYEYIAALGGDGYISAIADGVRKTNKILVPLPAGRGNDFCRKLDIGTNALEHLKNINNFAIENIDIAVARDVTGKEKTVLGIASLGIDSVANQYANGNRFLKGMAVYIWGFFKAVRNFKPITYNLNIDGKEYVSKSWSVCISSTGIYGGGIKLLPISDVRDGIMEVLTLENISLWGLMKLLPKIVAAKHLSHPSMVLRQGRKITVDCQTKYLPYADGDPIGKIPITVTVLPGALKVLH